MPTISSLNSVLSSEPYPERYRNSSPIAQQSAPQHAHKKPGMNSGMAAIMFVFQIFWVYCGLLIASRPVIIWNVVRVLGQFSERWCILLLCQEKEEAAYAPGAGGKYAG